MDGRAKQQANLIQMDVLKDDEMNRPHRIRAATEVHNWLGLMTAAERGNLLTRVFLGAPAGSVALEAQHETMRAAWATGKYKTQREMGRAFGWSKSAISRALKPRI